MEDFTIKSNDMSFFRGWFPMKNKDKDMINLFKNVVTETLKSLDVLLGKDDLCISHKKLIKEDSFCVKGLNSMTT